MIVAIVDDLLFGSKIRAAAHAAGASLQVLPSATDVASLGDTQVSLVIVDLAASGAIDRIRDLRAIDAMSKPIVAFASHVRADLIAAARAAGADRVLARSAFVAELPDLMRREAAARS